MKEALLNLIDYTFKGTWFDLIVGAMILCFLVKCIAEVLITVFRTINVVSRGYPESPYMDEEGGIIYPDSKSATTEKLKRVSEKLDELKSELDENK